MKNPATSIETSQPIGRPHWNPDGPLQGRFLFLSASVPAASRGYYQGLPPSAERITSERCTRAVVSVLRAVWRAGGRIVFGGHPTITPLVASVLTEFSFECKDPQEGPVRWFLSEAFRKEDPRDMTNQQIEALKAFGLPEPEWVKAAGDEKHDPSKGGPPVPASLTKMRWAMVEATGPAAMVLIGGMGGILEELLIFRKVSGKRGCVYPFATTDGEAHRVAAMVAEQIGLKIPELSAVHLKPFEREWLDAISSESQEAVPRGNVVIPEMLEKSFAFVPTHLEQRGEAFVPYPIIAEKVVEDLARRF